MRNRINRMITYRIPEQASISEADFNRLATRICEGTEQIRKSIKYKGGGISLRESRHFLYGRRG